TESDGGAITPVGGNADSMAPSGESASEEITEGINTEDANDAVASFINTAAGVALKGTDPVAYFTEGKPVPGSEEFSLRWNSVQWHFASAENRDLFSANPSQYAPQYGGHCAWAAAQGYVADIDRPNGLEDCE
ncbi:MAG: YHS domain-containing (seleno)protein, partial [Cyanobacteria bacterium P01_F01_bin.153]